MIGIKGGFRNASSGRVVALSSAAVHSFPCSGTMESSYDEVPTMEGLLLFFAFRHPCIPNLGNSSPSCTMTSLSTIYRDQLARLTTNISLGHTVCRESQEDPRCDVCCPLLALVVDGD